MLSFRFSAQKKERKPENGDIRKRKSNRNNEREGRAKEDEMNFFQTLYD